MQIAQKNFYKKFLGRLGENKAVEFLKQSGYTILATNFKTHVGEIDIIAKKDGVTVFIEVKTRSSYAYGAPSEAVDKKKQIKYVKTAQEYLIKNNIFDTDSRFDVIEIEDGKINHIINAFCM